MAFPDLFNTETREKEDLDETQIESAVAAGTHAFQSGTRVNIIAPDGTISNVGAENLKDAIEQGYKIETPRLRAFNESVEAESGLAGQAGSLIWNFANSAGFGVPEVVADKTIDPIEVARRAAIDKQNETASTVGKVLGIGGMVKSGIGQVLFSGAGKAGTAIETQLATQLAKAGIETNAKSMAARIVTKAAKYGTEGLVLASPKAATEALLGDPESAGETLLSGLEWGSMFAGIPLAAQGVKAGATKIGEIAQELGGKLAPKAGEALENLKINQAAHAFGATKAYAKEPTPGKYQPKKLGQKRINEIAEYGLNNGLVKVGESAEGTQARIAAADEAMGPKVRGAENVLDKIGLPALDMEDLGNEMLTQLESLDVKTAPAFKSQLKNLYETIDDYTGRAKNGVSTFAEAHALKNEIKLGMKANPGSPVFKRALGIISEAINKAQGDAAAFLEKEAGGNVTKFLEKKGIEGTPRELDDIAESIKKYSQNKEEWGKILDLGKLIEEKVAQQGGNKLIGPSTMTGTLAGAIVGGGGPVGIAIGAAGGALNVMRMRYGDQALAVGIQKLQKAMGNQGLQLEALGKVVKTGKAAFDKFAPSSGASIYAMQQLLGEKHPGNKLEALDIIRGKLGEFNSNPNAMSDILVQQLGDLPEKMPEIANAFSASMTKAITYLNQEIPKPPNAPSLFDARSKWRPSDREIAAFERKLQIVKNPMSIVKELADNTLTKEHVMALQSVYPKLYESMQRKVYESLANGEPNTIPYARRLKLSMFLGSAIEPSLNANRVQTLQKNFIPDKKAEQPRANSKLTVAENSQTDFNRSQTPIE